MSGKDTKQHYRSLPPVLTKRQIAILELIKLGMTDKAIGAKLGITEAAVANRVSHGILSRLGALNRTHAVYLALRRGIIS